jgi:hypothetical protein
MTQHVFDSLATIKSLEMKDLFCWVLKKGRNLAKRIAEWIKNADYCKGKKKRGISSFG